MISTTKTRTLEITVETNETFLVRLPLVIIHAWCVGCGSDVEMASAETAAKVTGIRTRAVYRQIESGEVHFFEEDGSLLICLNSLQVESEPITPIEPEITK